MRRVGIYLVATALTLLYGGLTRTSHSARVVPALFDGGTLTQDTTLTSADSPYFITNDIIVPAGIKLTLAPGTTLKMAEGRSILVKGEFSATGTATQPVMLTHDQAGSYWGPLDIQNSTANNVLSHTLVEYDNSALGIVAANSNLTIESSEIRHIQGSAVTFLDARGAVRNSRIYDIRGSGDVNAIHVLRGHVEIEGNQIFDGHDYFDAIDFDGDGTTVGLIRQNVIRGSNNDCIDIGLAAPKIEANRIYDCVDKGISLGIEASPLIINNVVHSTSIGVASKDGSHPILINNTIVNNQTGLSLYSQDTQVPGYATVHNSVIWGNDTGIQLRGGAQITITYSDVQTTTIWSGEGNLNVDPQFWAADAFDFRLRAASPCTDTANASLAPDTDIRGITRPQGAGVDMGAFEFFERAWLYLPVVRP